MMQTLLPYLIAALIAVAALLMLWMQRQTARRQQQAIELLQGDLRALCNAAVTMGERVSRIERQQRQLMQRQQELGQKQEQLAQEEPEGQSYGQAIKLAAKGASVDDLVDVCGISRGEAELVAMMHRLEKS